MALDISKPLNEGRLSTSVFVAGRAKLATLDSGSLEVNATFSIHAWNSGIRNTDHLAILDGILWNYFMSNF